MVIVHGVIPGRARCGNSLDGVVGQSVSTLSNKNLRCLVAKYDKRSPMSPCKMSWITVEMNGEHKLGLNWNPPLSKIYVQ